MKLITITLIIFLKTLFVFANNETLKKTKDKYNKVKSVSYRTTAFYPNPDTDEITSFTTQYTIYNFRDNKYDFYSKNENQEELYKNDIYTKINHTEKVYYEYENKLNQIEAMQFFNLMLYGPVRLLKYNWSFKNDTILNEKKHSHYSFKESEKKYEDKTIKVEFHIYISIDYAVSQFERKSYVDNKLGQTVTYKFDNYMFSTKKNNFNYYTPGNYSLKYFERIESLQSLAKDTKAPIFEAIDILGNKISRERSTVKTLLLFSSTNCGYSKIVTDFINDKSYKLNNDIVLINFFGSDSKEITTKYLKEYTEKYSIVTDRKDIEKEYGITGYPILYLVNENGIITETIDGAKDILPFLNSLNTSNNKR